MSWSASDASLTLHIDEAHRGTGDYAYAQAIRFLMAKNPHFRVLALTATPGSTPDAVQSIVDSLHISHIEIRDENSLDLKEYVFKKVCFTIHAVACDFINAVLHTSEYQATCNKDE
jgi:ERCC4-related helicase